MAPTLRADEDNVTRAEWLVPAEPVQKVAESGILCVPLMYVRPEPERPLAGTLLVDNVPVIDLSEVFRPGTARSKALETLLGMACKEWGFFHLVNHGINYEVSHATMDVCRGFFQLPMHEKLMHANDPVTYVGYGSKIGVQNGVPLDWSDYFFHHYNPLSLREEHKWPSKPDNYRETMKTYCEEATNLCMKLLCLMSTSLGLKENTLKESFGGSVETCVRLNYYPACPQPDVTMGLSPHSDPGGLTVLLQDQVNGLHVKKGNTWISVPSIPNALTVNIADQIEIMTNGMYKSVEHRVVVNEKSERMSIALFCNPKGDKIIEPIQELVHRCVENSVKYTPNTFNHYRKFIRNYGAGGKKYLHFAKSAA